jgi:hypothetical protein
MTYLTSPLVTENGKHRLHPYLFNLVTLTGALGVALHAVAENRIVDENSSISIQASSFDLAIAFPTAKAVRTAWYGVTPNRISLEFSSIPPRNKQQQGRHGKMLGIMGLAMPPIFIDFFENHRRWLDSQKFKIDQWPSTMAFARVLRHSFAHGGRLHMTDKNTKPVHWHHLRYDRSNDGKQVYGVGCELWMADLVFLLFELSDDFDRIGCPLGP